MLETPRRIGMITPSSNTVLEPTTAAITAHLYPRVTTHFTRVPVRSISLEESSLVQFDLDPMLRAACLLADAGMDVIVWNGTSGGWRGVEADYELCEAITRETGIPATTSTLAQFAALEVCSITSYALAVPYAEDVTSAIVSTYERAGFHCTSSASLGICSNLEIAGVPAATIRDLVRRADSPNAEAICIICTNLPAGMLVQELEETHRKPVLDSTVVTVWQAMRIVGVQDTLSDWGQLLRRPTRKPAQTE